MPLSDVLIHINETTNQAEQNDLVEQLKTLQGVIAPALIEKVRESGFKAQLVGL